MDTSKNGVLKPDPENHFDNHFPSYPGMWVTIRKGNNWILYNFKRFFFNNWILMVAWYAKYVKRRVCETHIIQFWQNIDINVGADLKSNMHKCWLNCPPSSCLLPQKPHPASYVIQYKTQSRYFRSAKGPGEKHKVQYKKYSFCPSL